MDAKALLTEAIDLLDWQPGRSEAFCGYRARVEAFRSAAREWMSQEALRRGGAAVEADADSASVTEAGAQE